MKFFNGKQCCLDSEVKFDNVIDDVSQIVRRKRMRFWLPLAMVLFFFSVLCPGFGECQVRVPDGLGDGSPGSVLELPGPQAKNGEGLFVQDGPVDPKEYIVGPGDVFLVEVWGRARLELKLEVDAEGRIFIPDSGSFLVGGKTLEEAKKLIDSIVLSAIPKGNVETRLVGLRRFKVHVSGEIDFPGSYLATQATRASEILRAATGDTLGSRLRSARLFRAAVESDTLGPGSDRFSSFRNIELRRRSGKTERVDLAAFLVTGDVSHNPYLSDGDIIYVPKLDRSFSISGAVMFPGTYELVDGENLSQVIRLVGGVTPDADLTKGEIRRFVSEDKTESQFFEVGSILRGEKDLEVKNGDRIFVRYPSHFLESHQVLVRGEVLFPGWYPINPREDKLSEVVARAGGLTPEADLSGARVIRPRSPASDKQGMVRCDMVKLFVEKRSENDVVLETGDIIDIPKSLGYVYVGGEVRRPGYVRYVERKRLGYYVNQAGGFTSKSRGSKTMVKRLSTGQSLSARDAGVILPYDSINVPARTEGARWGMFKDTMSILAQIATIYIVIDQATK